MFQTKQEMDQAVQAELENGGRIVETGNGFVKISAVRNPSAGERTLWTVLLVVVWAVLAVSVLAPFLLFVTIPVAVIGTMAFAKHATKRPVVKVLNESYEAWSSRGRA